MRRSLTVFVVLLVIIGTFPAITAGQTRSNECLLNWNPLVGGIDLAKMPGKTLAEKQAATKAIMFRKYKASGVWYCLPPNLRDDSKWFWWQSDDEIRMQRVPRLGSMIRTVQGSTIKAHEWVLVLGVLPSGEWVVAKQSCTNVGRIPRPRAFMPAKPKPPVVAAPVLRPAPQPKIKPRPAPTPPPVFPIYAFKANEQNETIGDWELGVDDRAIRSQVGRAITLTEHQSGRVFVWERLRDGWETIRAEISLYDGKTWRVVARVPASTMRAVGTRIGFELYIRQAVTVTFINRPVLPPVEEVAPPEQPIPPPQPTKPPEPPRAPPGSGPQPQPIPSDPPGEGPPPPANPTPAPSNPPPPPGPPPGG